MNHRFELYRSTDFGIRVCFVFCFSKLIFSFSRYEDFLALVTKAFDPKILFLTVIPLVAGLSTRVYSRLLLSVLLTEYANTLIKW